MKTVAVEVFERYKEAQKVSVASDGQAFIVDNGDAAAKNHAKNNAHGKELTLKTFMRDEILVAKKDVKATSPKAADVIAAIEKAETVEAVNALLGDDKRKTVEAAAAKRIEELEKAQGKPAKDKEQEDTGEGAETDTGANSKTE